MTHHDLTGVCVSRSPRRVLLVRAAFVSLTFGIISWTTTTEAAPGDTCSGGTDCDESAPFCVDNVCCDEDCASPCLACRADLKESRRASGTCGPTRQGLDPRDDCATDAPTSCGASGVCDGTGACQLHPQGTACGATTCQGGSVSGDICDGQGNCTSTLVPVSCAPYLCLDEACAAPCAGDGDCVSGFICTGGLCVPPAETGAACRSGRQCASGFCADGVCCNEPCSGQCEACALDGRLGTCSAVSGDPVGDRPPCVGEDQAPCTGTCDGATRAACVYPTSIVCATTCADAGTVESTCDGLGACVEGAAESCEPYACNTTTGRCRTNCRVSAECAAGFACEVGSAGCVPDRRTCLTALLLELPGGSLVDCSPFRCTAGACRDSCVDEDDCASGFACVGSHCEPRASNGGASAVGGVAGAAGGKSVLPGGGAPGPRAAGGQGTAGTRAPPRGLGDDSTSGGCGCTIPARDRLPATWWLWSTLALRWRRRRARLRRRSVTSSP